MIEFLQRYLKNISSQLVFPLLFAMYFYKLVDASRYDRIKVIQRARVVIPNIVIACYWLFKSKHGNKWRLTVTSRAQKDKSNFLPSSLSFAAEKFDSA